MENKNKVLNVIYGSEEHINLRKSINADISDIKQFNLNKGEKFPLKNTSKQILEGKKDKNFTQILIN
jgi:hypothetical protein